MTDQTGWLKTNEKHLAATVEWIRLQLAQMSKPAKDIKKPDPHRKRIEEARQQVITLEDNDQPPALNLLALHLGLTRFDCDLLALCTAMELDTRIAGLCATAQGNPNKPYPTFGLACALFDAPEWNTLSPHAPLRYWHLLEIHQRGVQPLVDAALKADERIVNFLKGINYLDHRLTSLLEPMGRQHLDLELPPSQQKNVENIIRFLRLPDGTEKSPLIELPGHDQTEKQQVAGHAAAALALNLYTIDLKALPGESGEFETFMRLWQRESLLLPLAMYIRIDGAVDADQTRLRRFLERSSGVVFLDLENAKFDSGRNRFTVEINKPTPQEQEKLWMEVLHGQAGDLPQRLAEQFSFGPAEIRRLARIALDGPARNGQEAGGKLWQICRLEARSGMEQLAQRVEVKAYWEQLVLPGEQKELLRQISDQVAHRNLVYEDWGFRQQMNRGLGINALFTGPSGTGKTMAAEVIAHILQLDLFRIDLSSVVSKYIGETEKNLRKLFDTAEESGAILFFDEADALFGKRSEVKDSHDRYANIEINYLLQRIETYRGLAILASNVRTALDNAFTRRLRFIVEFPFPGIEQRREIWRKVFPDATPLADTLDYDRLAQLNLTGGNIHNVALNAAFLAAEQGSAVTMPLLLHAARTEFQKLDRPLKESDFRWQEPAGVRA